MNYTQNTVAKITKVYAWLNFFACIIVIFYLSAKHGLDDTWTILWFGVSVVVNFEIYIVGEVVQLLSDIKQNTRSSAQTVEAESVAAVDTSDELPEL